MNKIFLSLALILCIFTSMVAKAEAPQEITLTVSSDGPTKDDATKNALRSAIEQAYGAFVSANTTILNDELVKDEIVTVSNGSIKNFEEISSIQSKDGGYFVTLSATVSLPTLVKYAQSHGSECEFAGNTFGMNEKIKDLQYENAKKIIANLTKIVKNARNVFDYELKIGEPVLKNGNYIIDGTVYVKHTSLALMKLIYDTLTELSKQLTGSDSGVYGGINLSPFSRDNWNFISGKRWFDGEELLKEHSMKFQINDNLSAPSSVVKVWDREGYNYFDTEYHHFSVYGYGDIRKPYKTANFEKNCRDAKSVMMKIFNDYRYSLGKPAGSYRIDRNEDFPISYSVIPDIKHGSWCIDMWFIAAPSKSYTVQFIIPKEDIGKYSKFWVEPVDK